MSADIRDAIRGALGGGDWRTPREIAGLIGVSPSAVRENLRVLRYYLVVERRAIGNAHEYRLRAQVRVT